MKRAALIYPHQLFPSHPALEGAGDAVMVEEPLLFSQYRFHRKKLILHRASMKCYAEQLARGGVKVHYVEAKKLSNTRDIATTLKKLGIKEVRYVDPCDDWLSCSLSESLATHKIDPVTHEDPNFLTSKAVIDNFTEGKKKLFFTNFYIEQRKRLGVLLDKHGSPRGGKWSFDPENRKKLPKNLQPPPPPTVTKSHYVEEAQRYVRKEFPDAIGDDSDFGYPIDRLQALDWLDDFLDWRFDYFGDYEDAISRENPILFHSVLTPALNIGLISPRDVIDRALAREKEVSLNSMEGFIRQVIGWREFMRLSYLSRGQRQRTRNFWGFTRPMPGCLYDGTTGIEPVDATIRKVLRTGYCHHIERLMVLGNFMLLCEIHPDAIYQWFMELFIDAYDWVMVPNVYAMSQFADGGSITTKPYFSGSNYLLKMSDYRKGPWCEIWDALFWRFVYRNRDVLDRNPRLRTISKSVDHKPQEMERHVEIAEKFLCDLS